MAQVYLPTPLRRLTHGQAKVTAPGRTVEEALRALEQQYPGLREQLREPTGEVRSFINVFVNGAVSTRTAAGRFSGRNRPPVTGRAQAPTADPPR